MEKRLKVLFLRNFRGLTGGHLKVWHYFNHVLETPSHIPEIYFSPQTVWDNNNPWFSQRRNINIVKSLESTQPDILFLAGLDWRTIESYKELFSNLPIINFIQGVRHGDLGDPRYDFLRKQAIRICVSQEVGQKLAGSQQVNGPIFVIPNGIDTANFPVPLSIEKKSCDILIAAFKQPEMGKQIEANLQELNLHVKLLTKKIPRPDFLNQINKAKISVFLPLSAEGFFLPALEGMALKTIVICPDCIGNRSFCLPEYNCFRPSFNLDAILREIHQALEISDTQREKILAQAQTTVTKHSLERERQSFQEILITTAEIWHKNFN